MTHRMPLITAPQWGPASHWSRWSPKQAKLQNKPNLKNPVKPIKTITYTVFEPKKAQKTNPICIAKAHPHPRLSVVQDSRVAPRFILHPSTLPPQLGPASRWSRWSRWGLTPLATGVVSVSHNKKRDAPLKRISGTVKSQPTTNHTQK
jgi:hypothetical protein